MWFLQLFGPHRVRNSTKAGGNRPSKTLSCNFRLLIYFTMLGKGVHLLVNRRMERNHRFLFERRKYILTISIKY